MEVQIVLPPIKRSFSDFDGGIHIKKLMHIIQNYTEQNTLMKAESHCRIYCFNYDDYSYEDRLLQNMFALLDGFILIRINSSAQQKC